MIICILAIIVGVIIALFARLPSATSSAQPQTPNDSEMRLAGERGEIAATEEIKSLLRDDDFLFTNVSVCYQDKTTELDNVIVNKNGVFIIEVKAYKGQLFGTEEDYKWRQRKADVHGNVYDKFVKNPVRQVKRQVYIFAKYLDYYGSWTWVDGYALLLENNSPIISRYILSNKKDIDRAIHTPGQNRLSQQQMEAIIHLLQ